MNSIAKSEKTHKKTAIKTIKVAFTGENYTPFGGLSLFNKFLRKLGVEKLLDGVHSSGDQSKEPQSLPSVKEGGYSVGRKILSVVNGLVLGLERPSDTKILQKDKVAQTLMEYEGYPAQSTLSRFLKSFIVKGACAIGRKNLQLLLRMRNNFHGWPKLTLDLDSEVKTVYGQQQRAKVGYNPKKPGRKSYHPLFCFIGETRDFLLGQLRAGNKYTGAGAIDFLRECLRAIPPHILQIYLRADSGFYAFDFLHFLEMRGILYAIAVKLYPTIQAKLVNLSYRDIGGGVAVAEYEDNQSQGPKKLRCRMVVIREKVKEGQKKKKQPKLFELQGYSYQVITTNIWQGAPEKIWRFYNGRANIENMIKEGAQNFGLEVSPSHQYAGNMAYLQIGMLAYNLVNWFKEKALNQTEHKKMLKWIRHHFFIIAGKLVSSGGSIFLKLSASYPYQKEYRQAEARMEALQI
jgi:hypothetical protein